MNPAELQHVPEPATAKDWDPLHATSAPGRMWSRSNIGEALPGVLTPLTWHLWEVAAEGAVRQAFYAMGAATKAEAVVPADRDQRFMRAFYGRGAAQLDFLCGMGNRIPGTSGSAIAEQVFGRAPESLAGVHTRRRYPFIAAKLPHTFLRAPGRLRLRAAQTEQWWRSQIPLAPGLNFEEAVRLFSEAAARFRRNVALQATTLFCVVQPTYDALGRLATSTGVGDITSLATGYGAVPEVAVVSDLWRVSRGEIDIATLVDRHGFHGPREGELRSQVWREDDTPLRQLVDEYRELDDTLNPLDAERALRAQRVEMEKTLLAALPATRRPTAGLLLNTASRVIPLRGIAKDSFLQASDAIRAAARRIGQLLAADGVLEDPGDIFFLTDDEISGLRTGDLRGVVALRRERFNYYRTVDLPTSWQGNPTPLAAQERSTDTEVRGVGVSSGVVEGFARVVTDPGFSDVELGEILVAKATDPSWASIMFISGALVVDIGGALSHAAIVARELALPCVVNTVTGTQVIRTGDRCRVDGDTGIVTIIERAPTPTLHSERNQPT